MIETTGDNIARAESGNGISILLAHVGENDHGWPVYLYDARDGGRVVAHGSVNGPARGTIDARSALRSAVAFLYADAESYRRHMGQSQPADGYLHDEHVAEWAYMNDDELSMILCELDEED